MASSALPDLQLGSDQLLDFLTAELATIESDLGGPDAEARGLLDMLQRQTRLIQQMSEDGAGGAPALTDLEIAQQIDSLDAQLSQLEASLSAADKPTMQLLSQSTDRWLNPDHSEHQAGNTIEEQPCCSLLAAAESAEEQPSDGNINKGSSGSSQQQAGLGAEQLPEAHGDITESGRGGGEAEEPAAVPDAAQQANGSSTEAEVAVAALDAAVTVSNSSAAQQL